MLQDRHGENLHHEVKLSVIIPAYRADATLPRTLKSIETAAEGLDVETIVVRDDEANGLPWARNRGLARATGDAVFFVDADDTVRPDFFRKLSAALETFDADFVLSNYEIFMMKRDYNLVGNDEIRRVMLPAFFGYAFEDVERWNRGGRLDARREQGGVCRCVFRRAFLERHRIRFDESLRLYEDAPFIAECVARAERVASIPDILYDYVPSPTGICATTIGSARYYDYKFAALRNRLDMAARAGGDLLRHFAASAVFTTLELLKARKDWRRYAAEPFVRQSLAAFPISWRHPLVAAAVLFLRARLRT